METYHFIFKIKLHRPFRKLQTTFCVIVVKFHWIIKLILLKEVYRIEGDLWELVNITVYL